MSEPWPVLVLDASVLINLLGSGRIERLLPAIAYPLQMADQAFSEVLSDPSGRMPDRADRQSLADRGLIRIRPLPPDALTLFLDLVAGRDRLDDGEAATIALAATSRAVPVLDERKARRVYRERFPDRGLASTAGLFRQMTEQRWLPPETVRESLFDALRLARMSLVPEETDWAVGFLGRDLASQCPSIRRSALAPRRT